MSEKMTELEAAKARIAMLREALEKIAEECKDNIDCNHQDADDGSDDCTDIDDCVGCTITALARSALSADPGEWLEGVKRQAQAELMEQWAEHPICDQFPAFRDKYLDLASELRKGAGDE